jgi:hypothetical protein
MGGFGLNQKWRKKYLLFFQKSAFSMAKLLKYRMGLPQKLPESII